MTKIELFPDPGKLPHKPQPRPHSKIKTRISGYPPYKDVHFSIRNQKHRHNDRFVRLRHAITLKMKGRKWYDGPVEINLLVYGPHLEEGKDLIAYVGGVMDSLDGSHGLSFTYLPIAYQDDCQVYSGYNRFITSPNIFYELEIIFR